MAVKLKRSVFIGLGGTGMKSILKTKQLYKDAFGDVPEIIGFLGIDTSTEEFAKDLKTSDDKRLRLEANEQVKMVMSGPLDYYHAHKDRFGWIPKNNVAALTGLSANGAGQIRTNGRFSFTINYSNVENGIKNAVNRVSLATNDGKGKWELVDDKIQIYLVFSLSGGTGCGIFLNVAYLIKELYGDRCVLQAYAVLPNAYAGCGQFVGANAYGAMMDADYLMTYVDGDNPFEYALLQDDIKTFDKPFDLVYLIDNMNRNGDKYTDPNQLYTMIGQALLAISGSIGSASAADLDNFKQLMIDGSLDIEDKKSWISGMGLCEILVNTKKLSKKYSLKAAQKLVEDMIGHQNPGAVDETATSWINMCSIREHEDNQLLDSLYSLNKIPDSDINSKKWDKAESESDAYISDAVGRSSAAIVKTYDEKIEAVKDSFKTKISDICKNGGGLDAAVAFISKVGDALKLYEEEMKSEVEDLNRKIPAYKAAVKDVINDWKNKRIFSRIDYASDLAEAQHTYVKAEVDKIRHDKAVQFFVTLRDFIQGYRVSAKNTAQLLSVVSDTLREMLSAIEYTNNDVNPFQIDLAASFTVGGESDPDCTVMKFGETLPDSDILSLEKMDSEEILKKVMDFTSSLPGTDFEDLSIEKIILKMGEEEKIKLFSKALRKSEILLDVENKGYTNEGVLRNALYVSVIGGKDGQIANDKTIRQMLEAETGASKPTYAEAPTDKSIMIFRQRGVYPVFQISTITRQQRDYEKFSEKKCFSFDAELHERLEDLHYSFTPNQQKDDDVLEMWVKGLVHGLIKRDGTRYVVWSPALCKGDGTNDYMYKLKGADEGQGTEARWFAFEDFKSQKRLLKSKGDLYYKIKNIEAEMGMAQVKELYSKVAGASFDAYVDNYSEAKITPATIKTSQSYRKTLGVIKDEDSYRRLKLVASLDK